MEHIGIYLKKIYFGKQSGVLLIRQGGVQKQLFFMDGSLVFAKTNQVGERLGEILFKLGKISEETFSQIEKFIEPGQNIGVILLAKGLISERNLNDGLIYQMKEITLNLFSSFDAEIAFQENKAYAGEGFGAKIDTPYLIEDGIRLMRIHPSLKLFLEKKTPVHRGREFLHLLTEEEKELLSKTRGDKSAEALFKISNYNPDFFWRSLYLFYCLNLVDLQETAEAKASPEIEIPPLEQVADDSQINEVLEMREKLASLNYFQVLNIPKEASEEEIKKAYFHLARKFHPDRFHRNVSPESRAQIEEVFDQITKAYRVLTNKNERKDYELKLTVSPREEERDSGKKADFKFRQGKFLFNQGRYDEAIIFIEESIRMKSNKGDYYLLLAMAESKVPSLLKKAEKDFLKAQELEPWNPEAFVGLGILYKQEGLMTKAARQFSTALDIDHKHAAAKNELELLGKGVKKTGLKALFSMDVFGKKKK